MRTALGAGRGRPARQLLTESLVLSAAGAVLGLAIAFAITTYLAHQGSIALPLLSSVGIDGAALAWTLLVAVAAGVFFGLAPELKISGGNLQEALKDSGHGMSEGRKHEGMRSVLIISEIALACVLLVGAGLLLRSFLRILDVDLGFQPSRAASVSVDFDDGNDPAKRSVVWQEILRRVDALPGVKTAGITDNLPLSRNRSWDISAKGKEYRKGGTRAYVCVRGFARVSQRNRNAPGQEPRHPLGRQQEERGGRHYQRDGRPPALAGTRPHRPHSASGRGRRAGDWRNRRCPREQR